MIGWRLHDIAQAERRRPLDVGEVSERAWLVDYARRVDRRVRALSRLDSVRDEIAALDATNRRRALKRHETDRLIHLVAIERRELALLGIVS